MMRRALFLILAWSTVLPLFALDFKYQGITYTVLNEAAKTCMTKEGSTSGMDVEGDIVIPETVFLGSTPYKVTVIGNSSFANSRITSITLPNSITDIGVSAFESCVYLTEAKLPNSIRILPQRVFYECTGLRSINIPETVVDIRESAFQRCRNLEKITLPNTLTYISSDLFRGCSSLTSVNIPETVTSLGSPGGAPGQGHCFDGCSSLTSIRIPESVTYIGWSVFEGCSSLTSIYLPNSITTIQYSAFKNCSSLATVHISNSVRHLENFTFAGCTSLESVEIPVSITSMDMAFESCTNLKTVILPKKLNSLGSTFQNCKSLTDIYIHATTPPDCFNGQTFDGVYLSSCTLHVPEGAKQAYSTANVWKNFVNIIDDVAPEYGDQITFDFEHIKYRVSDSESKTVSVVEWDTTTPMEEDVIIPESVTYKNQSYTVTSIDDFAFYYCTSFIEELPNTIESIGASAFANCNFLYTMKLPEKLLSIPTGLFSGCSNLSKVYLSDNITEIGEASFKDCVNLKSIRIPNKVTKIPLSAFSNCRLLQEVLIPNSVTSIETNAFMGCTSLKNIDLGVGLYYIGNNAFAGCSNIENIHSLALNPPYAEAYTFPIESYNSATVTVPEQSLSIYNRENPWYRFTNYLTVSGALSLSHYQVDMAANEVFQLGLYGAKSDIVWTSSNPSVAYANKCGLIVALGITGSTVITAHVDGEEINCRVTVSAVQRPAKANSRVSEDEDITQPVDVIIESVGGNPPMVNARLIPVGSCTVIDWKSSNSNLATVENGLVTINGDGEVSFGVTTENGIGEALITDTEDIDVSGIEDIVVDKGDVQKSGDVYDLTGRCVMKAATPEKILKLDKGIYIFKGEKILVK